MTERMTISVPDNLAKRVNDQLSYGDSRSEWMRDAIEMKLEYIEVHEPEVDSDSPSSE